jgi:hypothetical protein
MRKLFTFSRAQRRQTVRRWFLASFVMGAAAVVLPSLAINSVGPWAKSGAAPAAAVVQSDMAVTRTARQADCSDFDNQWDAQSYLQTQPAAHVSLDEDRDGIACESLP